MAAVQEIARKEYEMNEYILKKLLEIEKELVVGEEKNTAPKTLEKVRELSKIIAIRLNRENENKIIANK